MTPWMSRGPPPPSSGIATKTSGGRSKSMELYGIAFGAQIPDAAARLARVRAAGVPSQLGAKLLAAVAAWDWALGGGAARDCCELARAVLADGSLIARYPGYGATIPGIVLVLADDDEALAVWDAAMTGARQQGSLYSICSANIFRGWTWLQRGELAEAEDSLREAREQLRELLRPGFAFRRVWGGASRARADRAR